MTKSETRMTNKAVNRKQLVENWNVSFNKLRMELSQRLEFTENNSTAILHQPSKQQKAEDGG